ncbi:L-seryl-tRNA(Sec) kinase-like isoform X2 [Pomacea canaliculata]|uniref:L-seryl-tRNA(Sec) kinase-like isoform X2 n=1 Tax=Pomacea canaliculata TaxID=400727 RepID=UPI000D72BA65|nr:L-seryl-tRNA(Sec) kinase-like isoform X2 [Pomacea canaliculata]
MSQGCIVLMCGLPGSGKSTLASMMQSYAAQYHIGDPAVFHIPYDNLVPVESITELIYLKTNQEEGSSWKSVRGQVLSCVDCLLNYFLTHLHPENVQQQYNLPDTETLASHAIKRDVKTESCSCNDSSECKRLTKPADVDDILWQRFIEGFHKDLSINNLNFHKQEGVKLQSWLLLIDDNLYYSSMRYDYFKLSRKYNQGLCILHLFCELEMALNRNAARSVGRVEEAVIRAMGERFEPPDSGKRTWEKHSLTLDTCTAIDLDSIFHLVNLARNELQLKSPEDEEGKNISRYISSTNMFYQIDQILRRCMAKQMAALKVGIMADDYNLENTIKKHKFEYGWFIYQVHWYAKISCSTLHQGFQITGKTFWRG